MIRGWPCEGLPGGCCSFLLALQPALVHLPRILISPLLCLQALPDCECPGCHLTSLGGLAHPQETHAHSRGLWLFIQERMAWEASGESQRCLACNALSLRSIKGVLLPRET